MMRRKKKKEKDTVANQFKKKANKKPTKEESKYDGSIKQVISTGSTLLDLSISGGRLKGGGIPGGILVEIFGPPGAGKTVLLCEIGGDILRGSGKLKFYDPEARLDEQFAKLFDLDISTIDEYGTPDQVVEMFRPIRDWEPEPDNVIHGIMGDSLAALTSDLEAAEKKDAYSRRAKQFSEECRRTCRTLKNKNFLMVCSNQVRQNINAGMFEEKYKTTGGEAIPFYSSLRLQIRPKGKIKKEKTIRGKKHTRIVGLETQIYVYKSSVWKAYRTAPVFIMFDYGIDDIRGNLVFCKQTTGSKVYQVDGEKLSNSIDKSIEIIEQEEMENDLKEYTIDLWEDIERSFVTKRKPKRR